MKTATGNANGTTSTGPAVARRRWNLLRHRLRVDAGGALVLAAAVWVFAMVVVAVVSTQVEIRISGWEVATQIARWFVGGIGVYLSAVYLPLYVAHGCTRRDTARQFGVFGAVYVPFIAVLVVLGFGLERLVYGLAGWPQVLDATTLASGATDYAGLLLQYTLIFAVWLAGGALVGAGFYRRGDLGTALLVPAVGLVVLVEWAMGGGGGDRSIAFVPVFGALGRGSADLVPIVLVVGVLVAVGLMTAATWWLVRDLSLSTEPS